MGTNSATLSHLPYLFIISSQVRGILSTRKQDGIRRCEHAEEKMGRVAQLIVGVVLFVLVIGIWACLWVPPSPAF